MGPSPLILHATLSRSKPSGVKTLQALRQVRVLLEAMTGSYWDLYCVQMLPCMWRKFLRSMSKRLAMDSNDLKKTAYRMLAEETFQGQRREINNAKLWLTKFDLYEDFERLPRMKKREFIVEFKWEPGTTKKMAKQKLISLSK